MALITNTPDSDLDQIKTRLEIYEAEHPGTRAELYRQNSASIRIRVIDNAFAAMSRSKRQEYVWKYFEALPDDIQQQITVLLLLAPGELKSSFMNFEFDDPIPTAI